MEQELPVMLKYYIPGILSMIVFSHMEAVQQSFLDFKGPFAGYFVRQLAFFSIIAYHAITKTPFTLQHLAIYQSICITLGAVVLYMSTPEIPAP